MSNSSNINWGVLGFARIFQKRMMAAFEKRKHAHCVKALSSKSADAADMFAEQHHIPKTYRTYEEILDDAAIDAVYIPLPNSLHHQWATKAAIKGKHILCEKPLGYEYHKMAELLDLCRKQNVVLMESHSYRLHPQHAVLSRMIKDDVIGDIKQIQVYFSFPAGKEHAIRFDAGLGGGALLDLGCYGIDFMNHIFDEDVNSRRVDFNSANKVDMEFMGVFKFHNNREVNIRVSFLQSRQQTIIAAGEKGSIFLPNAFIPSGSSAFIHINNDQGDTTHEIENPDQYALLLDEFSNAMMNHEPNPVRYDRYLKNARILDDLLNERESS